MANEITRGYNKASAVYIKCCININPVWTLLDNISALQLNAACTLTLSYVLTHCHIYSYNVTVTLCNMYSHTVMCTHTLSHVLTHCNMYLHTG